jgi:hypothetical protein
MNHVFLCVLCALWFFILMVDLGRVISVDLFEGFVYNSIV